MGNFAAIDDAEAQRTLKKLKAAEPDCLNPNREKEESRSLAWWRKIQAQAESIVPKEIEGRKLNGPLSRAFITRNPLLPEEYFVPKTGLDEFVVKMNKNVKFSLLDCPGKYTVQVAHFTGEVILNQGEIRAIESGSRPGPESTKQGLAAGRREGPRAYRSPADERLGGLSVPRPHLEHSYRGTLRMPSARSRRTEPSSTSRHVQRIVDTFAESRRSNIPAAARIQNAVVRRYLLRPAADPQRGASPLNQPATRTAPGNGGRVRYIACQR